MAGTPLHPSHRSLHGEASPRSDPGALPRAATCGDKGTSKGFTEMCNQQEFGDLANSTCISSSVCSSSTARCPALCSLGSSGSSSCHPLLVNNVSITRYLLMDLHPSELGKVETTEIRPCCKNLTTCAKTTTTTTKHNKPENNNNKKQSVLADRNVLNQDLLGFVLPNPAMKALVLLHWQSDRK